MPIFTCWSVAREATGAWMGELELIVHWRWKPSIWLMSTGNQAISPWLQGRKSQELHQVEQLAGSCSEICSIPTDIE